MHRALFILVIGCAAVVDAQHSDIAIYRSSLGQVTTHNESGAQEEVHHFRRDFDFWGPPFNVYAGDDPGFRMSGLNPPSGYAGLPGSLTLDLAVLPIHLPGATAGNLLFWDGVGDEVDVQPVPIDHTFFLEDAAGTEIGFQGGIARFEGLVAGVTDTNGGMHEHLTFAVDNGGAEPEVGFYMMGWQLSADGYETSELTTVVLSTPSIPFEVEQQFDMWLQSQVDTITLAGDFDDNGEYELADIDALVASIASGADDPVFDLTGDGVTDRDDLDFWREIAGVALNDSLGPVLVGDADLNGVVDGQDFIAWNNNKFTSLASWSGGDFNADGLVDGQDFVAWNTSKFQAADAIATVPEPAGSVIALACWFAVTSLRRRK